MDRDHQAVATTRGLTGTLEQWQRVAAQLADELDAKGWDAPELARRAKVSKTTVYSLLGADQLSYRRSTLTAIADALDWIPNAFAYIISEDDTDEDAAHGRALPPGSAARGRSLTDLSEEEHAVLKAALDAMRRQRGE